MLNNNLAVYIDGDNANYKEFSFISDEIKKYGKPIISRIYGDWTKSEMKGWKNIAIKYAYVSVNCFSLRKKNSTDINLICDILKDLYKNPNINSFIIVSSDSDYTHVTKIIREEGKKVIGIGRSSTPLMLKNSCDIFISTNVLSNTKKINKEEIIIPETTNELKYDTDDPVLRTIYMGFNGSNIIEATKLYDYLNNNQNNINQSDILNTYPDNFMIRDKNNITYILDITGIKKIVNDIFDNQSKDILNMSIIKDTLLLHDSNFDHRNYGFNKMLDFVKVILSNEIEILKHNKGTINIRKKDIDSE